VPTPDTDALAARLRAVERALTDEETTLDPPEDHETGSSRTPPETAQSAGERLRPPSELGPTPPEGTDTGADIRADGAGTGLDRRLTRLEAAVQALRAALDGTEIDEQSRSESDTEPGDGADPPAPAAASGAVRRGLGETTTEAPTGRWPDDLAEDE
jgi:hypothetical protein